MTIARRSLALLAWAIVATLSACSDAQLPWVQVADDGKGFVLADSGKRFVPWGFNYDHEGDGQLIEDYWDEKWPTVEAAFHEMKQLGANVVRIHLQFGRFMESPTVPRQHSLRQLARLVKLAERTGLYLDLTGLGCYHKQDVPEWYDKLSEQETLGGANRVLGSDCQGVCTESRRFLLRLDERTGGPRWQQETRRLAWTGIRGQVLCSVYLAGSQGPKSSRCCPRVDSDTGAARFASMTNVT